MIQHRRFDSFAGEDLGWMRYKTHFPYGGSNGWGSVFVLGDDIFAPQGGFPLHPHANMEIITYVVEGAITHCDDMGNAGRTEAGDVQVMSTGTGVRHSEYNLEKVDTRLFQIWIRPAENGGAPAWGTRPFPRGERAGAFVTLASGFEDDDGALPIRTPSRVMGALLNAKDSISHKLLPGRHAYLILATGRAIVSGIAGSAGDAFAISDASPVDIEATEACELILIDTP